MPGKHAPKSPFSYYLSLARAFGGALAVLGLVVGLVVVAVSSRGGDAKPEAKPTPTKRATTATTTPTPPGVTLRPKRDTTVIVLNAAGRQGLASRVAGVLGDDGYDVVQIGNAARAENTRVYYRRGAAAEAERIRLKHFPFVGRVNTATAGRPAGQAADGGPIRGSWLVAVVLGADYP